jgi:AcrR family transcriptional regulator
MARQRERARALDRRQALVQAAYRLIAEKGLEGLRLRDVAAQVGIEHPTLHHYFATKEDLIAEVVDYATWQCWSVMPVEGSAADQLRRRLEILARMIEERPELFIVLRELDLRAARDSGVSQVIEEREEGWRARLIALLGDASGPGRMDPATAAELIIAAVKGASFRPRDAVRVLALLGQLLIRQEQS